MSAEFVVVDVVVVVIVVFCSMPDIENLFVFV